MIIDFKSKGKIREHKDMARGIIGIKLPEYIRRVDSLSNLSREGFYRLLFGIDNAIFISKDANGVSETLIILDVMQDDYKYYYNNHLISFSTNGLDGGTYTCPIISIENISFGILKDFNKFIDIVLEEVNKSNDNIN